LDKIASLLLHEIRGVDFARFADQNLHTWNDTVNLPVKHTKYDSGVITGVEQRKGNVPLIYIRFDSEDELLMFNSDSFKNGMLAIYVSEEIASQVSKVVDTLDKEDRAIARLESLCKKYQTPQALLWEDGALSRLAQILEKVESGDVVDHLDIEWLKSKKQFSLLSQAYLIIFDNSKKVWDLVMLCKYLRRSKSPDVAIEQSNRINIDRINDVKAASALLTTQGGSYRDLNKLDAAINSAQRAISAHQHTYHPYNLMGALLYQKGMPADGDWYFDRAISLGSPPKTQEDAIRQTIQLAAPDARRAIADYLLSKSPDVYGWVRRFMNDSP